MKKVMQCDDCRELYFHDHCIKIFCGGAFLILCEWCFCDYVEQTKNVNPKRRIWFKYIGTVIH